MVILVLLLYRATCRPCVCPIIVKSLGGHRRVLPRIIGKCLGGHWRVIPVPGHHKIGPPFPHMVDPVSGKCLGSQRGVGVGVGVHVVSHDILNRYQKMYPILDDCIGGVKGGHHTIASADCSTLFQRYFDNKAGLS